MTSFIRALSTANLAGRSQTVLAAACPRKGNRMHIETNIDVLYIWGGICRSATVTLPIRHAENAYAWLKAHHPEVEVLDTRKSGRE